MQDQERRIVNIAPLESQYERYLEDLDKQFESLPQDANEYRNLLAKYIAHSKCLKALNNLPDEVVDGNTSDGFHTFNELYHHRAVLFSVIVSVYPQLCWKSRLHSDGTMCDGMFIVGINTPEGTATYHYHNDLWDLFHCKVISHAPEWDGHTSDQAIQRIASLQPPYVAKALTYAEALEQSKYDGAVWFVYPGEVTGGVYAKVYESSSSRGKAVIRTSDSVVFSAKKDNYGKTWVCFNTKPLCSEANDYWRSFQ